VLSGVLPRRRTSLVLCGVQTEEVPQFGSLIPLLGVNPKEVGEGVWV
jgi:hypothetical protein